MPDNPNEQEMRQREQDRRELHLHIERCIFLRNWPRILTVRALLSLLWGLGAYALGAAFWHSDVLVDNRLVRILIDVVIMILAAFHFTGGIGVLLMWLHPWFPHQTEAITAWFLPTPEK